MALFSKDQIQRHWPDRWYAGEAEIAFLRVALPDRAAVFALEGVRAAAWRYGGERFEILPVASEEDVPSDGRSTLVFEDIHLGSEPIAGCLKELEEALGVPLRSSSAAAFLSAAGCRTEMHFDQQHLFVVLLQGRKTWKIAPNGQIPFPRANYKPGMPVDRALEEIQGDFPRSFPANHDTVELKPGSTLFLPAGMWHETETQEDSIQLVFAIRPRAWVDLILKRLHDHLVRQETWRRPVGSLDPGHYEDTRRQVQELLHSLLGELQGLDADEVLRPEVVDRMIREAVPTFRP